MTAQLLDLLKENNLIQMRYLGNQCIVDCIDLNDLSPREQSIAKMKFYEKKTNGEIAAALEIRPRTVKNYRKRIERKMVSKLLALSQA